MDAAASNGADGCDDALFRAAHDHSPEPFELLRPLRRDDRAFDFCWLYLNPAAAAMLGRDASELIGRPVLGSGDAAFNGARCSHWIEVLEHGEARRASFSRAGKDSAVEWFQTLSLPYGEGIAAVTRNMSAEAAEAQRRGPGWNDDLLASVSHELRTPLNAIVGWAHLLARPEADAALLLRAAEAIGRNARALASLIDDLLDINRIVNGTLRLDRQYCDLSAAVLSAVQAVRPAAQQRWIHLQTDQVAPALACWGDPKRVEQLLGNLLSLAVQSTPLDGVIEVSATARGGYAHVVIRDTGDGLAPDQLTHVFARHAQADAAASRRHGGLGLGLAVVRSLVELHGGRLAVHSDGVGLGTTVEVELPLPAPTPAAASRAAARPAAPDTPVSATVSATSGAGAAAETPLAWRRILVLEDEADSLELMTVLLRQQGAVVHAFDNAEQALAAAENGSFDLIISDLGMAGMDGLEFMRRLKRRPVPMPVKAIALTAYAGDAHRVMALDAGYSRVEVKPISPPQFLAVVLAESRGGAAVRRVN